MTKLITYISSCFMVIAATAQNAVIEVGYIANSPNFMNGETDVKNQYVLLASVTESKFFSPITEYIDSLSSTPEGVAKLREMTQTALNNGDFDSMPTKDGSYYVMKSLSENKLLHFDSVGLDKYYYVETLAELDWEILDITQNILGYECVKATTCFHGRKWEVWFSPEIPVSNGPWKLGGLPGLILEATTDGGQFSFIATGIQKTAKHISPVYLANEYEKISRIKYLKAKRAFIDNPVGHINVRVGGGAAIDEDSDAVVSSLFVADSAVDFLEIDYR